jgi:hypothetical protein
MLLFAFQRRGTAAVGLLFRPVMIVWFAAIGAGRAHGPRHRRGHRNVPAHLCGGAMGTLSA